MPKWPILFIVLIFVFSCGKTTDEETQDVVLNASIELSRGNCQDAIDILEAHGRKTKNAQYLKALSSAYACRAGYSTVTFYADDISKTVTPAPFGGTSLYSTSQVTTQNPFEDDPQVKDLQTAIDILLYAGGIASTTEPTSTERTKYFTTAELADLNAQLLYMMLVQYGKFAYNYGNTHATTGVKGTRVGASNLCFTSYAHTLVPPTSGTCTVTNSSNSQLDETLLSGTPEIRKRRLCQGVVLTNGILDLLPALVSSALPAGSQAGANAAIAAIALLKTAAGSIGQVLNTQSQTQCENNAVVSVANLETYYAVIVEGMVQ
jgi:hypothetical protein